MQEKEFVIRFDEEYTYDSQNSRTYSTEAQGTKYDKQITAGKGFQQTIRTRLITDYPGEIEYSGATIYSVASGANNHNKGPYNTVQLECTDRIDEQDISKISSLGFPTTFAAEAEYHTKMERYAVFNMVKNKSSVGGIREAYTNVNYPDSYLTPNNNTPAPLNYITDYLGLRTYSIINITNKTVLDNSSPDGQGLKFGICFKDNMIVLGNYHNDYWVKPVDRDEIS